MASAVLAWSIFAAVCAVVIWASGALVSYFEDPDDRSKLARWVLIILLSMQQLSLFAVPLDIYNCVHDLGYQDAVRLLYYTVFFTMFTGVSVVVPYVFFYNSYWRRLERKAAESATVDDGATEATERCWSGPHFYAFLRTFIAVAFMLFFVVLGVTLRFGKVSDLNPSWESLKHVLELAYEGETSVAFIVACMVVCGLPMFVWYTGFGSMALPWALWGIYSSSERSSEYDDDIFSVRDEIRLLRTKYAHSGRAMSTGDRLRLQRLMKKERRLAANSGHQLISQYNIVAAESCLNRVLAWMQPFVAIIGIVFLVCALAELAAVSVTVVNRTLHSQCGWACGFLATTAASLYNPLDFLLVYTSKLFPLDYIILGFLLLVVFIGALYGIASLGVRILCFRIYTIRKRQTSPQALLVMCSFLLFLLLALLAQMPALIPQYVTFGAQEYRNTTSDVTEWCSVRAVNASSDDQCRVSQLSILLTTTKARIPFFGAVFYVADWMWLVTLVVSLLYMTFCRPRKSFERRVVSGRFQEQVGLLDDLDDDL